MTNRNVFACLVHEAPDCVVDLVRNLRFLDPESTVLLYDGSQSGGCLDRLFQADKYEAVLYPNPRPMTWGCLHHFALECMRFALSNIPFDTLTIVDSDQLGVRNGYSRYLTQFLEKRDRIGALVNSTAVHRAATDPGPVQAALREVELWRPFLRRFTCGEEKFAHWSFWPSTVYTDEAARDLTDLFANDRQLQQIMTLSRIWATEEVVLPTVTALLGYEIAANPCSYDFVKYRTSYSSQQIDTALSRTDVFWIHPVARSYDDPLRRRVRVNFGNYECREPEPTNGNGDLSAPASPASFGLPLTLPILQKMRPIAGWLDDHEADLLIAAAARAVTSLPTGSTIVEVGSYCGRGTVVLGSVVAALRAQTKVYAIDPHDGRVGALDQGIKVLPPTLDRFMHNIMAAGLNGVVVPLARRATDAAWDRPIGLLVIDGLHDYGSVSSDFLHFRPWLVPGGYIAFHDYAKYYPGVQKFVDELVDGGEYRRLHIAGTMVVLQAIAGCSNKLTPDIIKTAPAATAVVVSPQVLVS